MKASTSRSALGGSKAPRARATNDARARSATASRRVRLWLRNETGRLGVPLRPSFERWLAAIPALHERRGGSEISILIVGAREGRRFNREFRGRDYATNVLSFPFDARSAGHRMPLGDLVICAPVVAREAREQKKPPRDHFAHLTVHGVLHLLGHDHENDADAEQMEALERSVLSSLGLPDPYLDRVI